MDSRIRKHLLGGVALGGVLLLSGCTHMTLLDPKGPIAAQEESVILFAFGLMLIVVIPVMLMTVGFAWRYRASRTNAAVYAPHWDRSWRIELAVWVVPAVIVAVLGALVWTSTHKLSPSRALVSANAPVVIEAVALDWKWLFIYPQEHIATVNEITFPVNTPVDFKITSATVMNSFFIPRLGSQIYAMAGMQTKLNLMADQPGVYTGLNSQFSGRGFSSMKFKAIATSNQAFKTWVDMAKQSQDTLDGRELKRLERPSTDNPVAYYSSVDSNLFEDILHQYKPLPSAGPTAHSEGERVNAR